MTKLASILIGGDCGPTHGPEQGFPVESYTHLVAPYLRDADFRFVNCMRTYSDRGVKSDHAPQVCQPVEMSTLFTGGLFDAVTMANNHSLDAGPEAMLDTRKLFLEKGLRVTGAGRDLDEARQPAIVEKAGVRVGYLGYTSVATAGTDAGKGKPGVVNIRVKTSYETRGPHQPVRVWTSPIPQDLARLTEDITDLRKKVDVVVLAYHAGAIRLPRIVSDYQVAVAHAAIDAGADLVVGHAPHIPKAIEVYKGKVIFYSLGVFAMTKSFAAPAWTNEPAWAQGAVRNFMDLDPAYPLMPYGKDCTLALLAKAYVSPQGVAKVSFLPVKFDSRYRPEVLRAGDPRFDDVVEYMKWASEDMPHKFDIEDDEVVVTAS
jgi:poly-gamma-glutamate synthesis protein (capsule biosynthesis protein)